MRLIEELERRVAAEESLFRAQLLREDLGRLRKLKDLAARLDRKDFLAQGKRIGWTQGDARTAEIEEPLERLLEAVYAFEAGPQEAGQEVRIAECWQELHRARMERLLGCLSTPVPKPAG